MLNSVVNKRQIMVNKRQERKGMLPPLRQIILLHIVGILCNTGKNAGRSGKTGELGQMARLFVQFGFSTPPELSTSG